MMDNESLDDKKLMRYTNGTLTEIRLVAGDIRDAKESFVVIGRDQSLRCHYEELTGKPFSKMTGVMEGLPVQTSRAEDRRLHVLATSYRPRDSARRQARQIYDLQSVIEYPLTQMLSWCDATEVAMVPISCRAPTVVATGMIRVIWDISVAAFLDVEGPMKSTKPTVFTIYCNSDLKPFIDVLDNGHYASMSNGWLFSTELQCSRAKLARYLARRKFKYRRAEG